MSKICLIGHPNSGKSLLFNAITNSENKVGNWSGVTVELGVGKLISKENKKTIEVFDLPGCYTLWNNTKPEEKVSADFILTQEYDLILNLVDVCCIKKSLPLTLQLIELGKPLILILNKCDQVDEAECDKLKKNLEQIIDCPVLTVSGLNKSKMASVIKAIESKINKINHSSKFLDFYPKELVSAFLNYAKERKSSFYNFLTDAKQNTKIKNILAKKYGDDLDLALLEMRYEAAKSIINLTNIDELKKRNRLEWIDRILLSKTMSIPLFLLMMYLIFQFSINFGSMLQPYFESFANYCFIQIPEYFLSKFNLEQSIVFFIFKGLGLGIKTVVSFIPLIMCLYLPISALEESGYLVRIAFLMNSVMKKIWLDGRSIIPIILGFGCNVPAIMAARVVKLKAARIAIIMSIPFMSCSARLTVFLALCSIFFPNNKSLFISMLYLIGIIFGILSAFLIGKFLKIKSDFDGFLEEIPELQIPRFNDIVLNSYKKTTDFVRGAGKAIIKICIVIQLLSVFSFAGKLVTNTKDSIMVQTAKSVTWIFKGIGITEENWPASVSLVTGLLAKEVVVGTLNILYADFNDTNHAKIFDQEDEQINLNSIEKIKTMFGGDLEAFCYMVFVLLYFPCISVFSVIKKEIGVKWAILSSFWSTTLAYTVAGMIYQCGKYFKYGEFNLFLPNVICLILCVLVMLFLYRGINKES